MEDKTLGTHTKPSKEIDLSNYALYFKQKLFRSKTKDEQNKLIMQK